MNPEAPVAQQQVVKKENSFFSWGKKILHTVGGPVNDSLKVTESASVFHQPELPQFQDKPKTPQVPQQPPTKSPA